MMKDGEGDREMETSLKISCCCIGSHVILIDVLRS